MSDLETFKEIKELLITQKHSQEDIEQVEKAYRFAKKLHDGQFRASGEPYIIHPVEVAKILAGLEVDTHTLIAAFLHDVLEDTDTKPETIEELFGSDVLNLVQGVTKLGKLQFKSKEERQAENFRRLFIAMANDIRVIFLKLADRLHNMRTLNFMEPEKQKKIAKETLDIFAPLANRLGIYKIKAELEDLSLRYLEPEKYYEIAQLVAQTKADREETVNLLIDKISKDVQKNGINAQITGRAKHYYSIYAKMKRQNIAFNDLYDITAVRVIVDTVKECYEVLGLIHSQFKPIPGRFKDYIAMPKGNMYQSLHTSVIGPRSKPLEVQIRTWKMHQVAEYGIAAHWRYKEKGSQKADNASDMKFSWMHKLVEYDKEMKNAEDYVKSVKLDLFSDQVFAFTPNGDVLDLPKDATPVDFSYRIHSDVGHKTVGALVNGRIVPLNTKLNNGDIVEILTSKTPAPRLDWLTFVVTKQASQKIRQWFKKNNREEHVNIGKTNLEHELTKAVFDECLKNGEFDKVAKSMNYQSAEDLFAALGYGETTLTKVINKVRKPIEKKPEDSFHASGRKNSQKDIIGLEGLLYSFARCCSPIPGEPIVGVVTRAKGVTVHRVDCKTLETIPHERLMDIHWAGVNTNKTYTTTIRIETAEKLGLLKDVIAAVSDNNANIVNANIKTKNHVGIIELGIELDNIDTFKKVVTCIQSLPDVFSVKRIQTSSSMIKNSSASKPQKPMRRKKTKKEN
ncbi:TPA: bifunctional (p)ppGpp synthetase/guanosine-3',5'-bis(diphosphate) 3'-pyrophosphohydrolase [Candidatus Gastranaerophilales bacterium HUM_6]|nr:bifunctional (p)ppGpp synthetase/guanosine-3',5'-bis(diphosphate) 3'-pyrophosphohydrolase [bacterium]CDE91442.1 (P)ppGpp synthetase I SpoT/RelA [Fusobacterium sp. CAG:815]DAA92999.1 MAG TPA: bifunctional (p)ppGpp synthetase/guanosine-3',5'-bis(diphosphate) 3'-pyrophosphohydrolase [Candidatus Gastranaerophilales bacterium HUM_6]DAB02932.1 MAG TPA: bifunctional (p)ppGpp synthetase/guanosine-3',5'-bis(diphosphate) 3'-pyrophosphohydrolase [Candidatus Gastranaerophilales bacterium HUM_12]DAB04951